MRTETITYFYYEFGDRLRHKPTGKIITFVKYNNDVCDTVCIKDKDGEHTWGRKIIEDRKYFELALDYSKVDSNHICPADDCCSKLEREVQYEKLQKTQKIQSNKKTKRL